MGPKMKSDHQFSLYAINIIDIFMQIAKLSAKSIGRFLSQVPPL
jgi:hypothetical protein